MAVATMMMSVTTPLMTTSAPPAGVSIGRDECQGQQYQGDLREQLHQSLPCKESGHRLIIVEAEMKMDSLGDLCHPSRARLGHAHQRHHSPLALGAGADQRVLLHEGQSTHTHQETESLLRR